MTADKGGGGPELILQLVDLHHEAHQVVDGDPTEDLVWSELVELMQLLQPLQLCPQVGPGVDDRLHIPVPDIVKKKKDWKRGRMPSGWPVWRKIIDRLTFKNYI